MKPILSVCIPTFNRSNILNNTLKVFIDQVKNLDSPVEIVISDNASYDETQDIVNKYCKIYPFVKYFRNDLNFGFDRNVDICINKANGDYVWIVSDDDYYEPDALRKIILVIEDNPAIEYIFLNYGIYKNNFKDFVAPSRVVASANCIVSNGNEFFKKTLFANTLVSSNIFKMSLWLKSNALKYYGTAWIHFYVSRDILLNVRSYIFHDILLRQSGDELVLSRKRTMLQRLDIPNEYYLNAHLKFTDFVFTLELFGYDKKLKNIGLKIAKKDNLRQIVYYKLIGRKYSPKELFLYYKLMYKYFKYYFSFWAVDIFILALPSKIVKTITELILPLYKFIRGIIFLHKRDKC